MEIKEGFQGSQGNSRYVKNKSPSNKSYTISCKKATTATKTIFLVATVSTWKSRKDFKEIRKTNRDAENISFNSKSNKSNTIYCKKQQKQ